jgi:NAD(P)-dependent dehydrogenase (short-subunit alcohol dehydrogenase family)
MALEQFDLSGRVAIVTGAGKGVGQGIARVLAEAVATVVGTARTQSDIEATIADIEKAGGKGLAVVADAMSRPDGERVVNATMERLGLESLTRAMAQELAPKIRVNAIALGSFATDGL